MKAIGGIALIVLAIVAFHSPAQAAALIFLGILIAIVGLLLPAIKKVIEDLTKRQ